jgi:hypothetical protein
MEFEPDSLPIDPYTREILPGGIAVLNHLGVMVAWLPVPTRAEDAPDITEKE